MIDKQTRYSSVAIALHWIIAGLMIYMLFWGEGLIRRVQGSYYPSIHASIGISILLLSVGRLAWRLMNPPPALPGDAHSLQNRTAEWGHWAFYILMIGTPLTGMADFANHLVRNPTQAAATVFGLFPVPQPNLGPLGSLHGPSTKLMIGLLIIHVLAALKHQFWDKDNLLKRVIPL